MKKFSVRDWFWLTLVVAMGVGWWLDHRRDVSQQHRLVGQLQDHDKRLVYNARLLNEVNRLRSEVKTLLSSLGSKDPSP